MNARHLEYDSIDDWISGENVPPNVVSLLGWYHMDRIVLMVYCDQSNIDSASEKPPWLFQGFEVFYLPRKDEVATEP